MNRKFPPCQSFVSAHTSLFKVKTTEIRKFPPEIYSDPPDGSTLRKSYLPEVMKK
jgi:hypothetical protein